MALVWKRKKNGEGDPSFLSDVIEAIDWMGEQGCHPVHLWDVLADMAQ